jgi:hypothetical protein
MSDVVSLTSFLPGDTVKYLSIYGMDVARVVNVEMIKGRKRYLLLFRNGQMRTTFNSQYFFVSEKTFDSAYLMFRFTQVPACELGIGCCPGSGCCYSSCEEFNLAASNAVAASYKASYLASFHELPKPSFQDIDEMYLQ